MLLKKIDVHSEVGMKDRNGLHMCSTAGRVCKVPKIDIYDEMEDRISGHLIVWPYGVNRRS